MAKMCRKCGTLLENGVQTCSQCGEAVYSRSAPSPSETPSPVSPSLAPSPKKKLTISEKKERKATKKETKAQENRKIIRLLIIDLILLLLLLGCAGMILDVLGIVDIPFIGSESATETLSNLPLK